MKQIVSKFQADKNYRAVKLDNTFLDEVLNFLQRNPVYSFSLSMFITNNGLESSENRGSFYGFFDRNKILSAIALVGWHTIFAVSSEDVIQDISQFVQKLPQLHLILGTKSEMKRFWNYFPLAKKAERKDLPYVLLLKNEFSSDKSLLDLKLATPADLEIVAKAHAQVILEERDYDPLEKERESFTKRCLKRIERKQTWIQLDNNEICFKAELLSQTPEIAYIEAVWVKSDMRGKGYGSRCLNKLTEQLSKQSKQICLLARTRDKNLISFYKKLGFKVFDKYTASLVDT